MIVGVHYLPSTLYEEDQVACDEHSNGWGERGNEADEPAHAVLRSEPVCEGEQSLIVCCQ